MSRKGRESHKIVGSNKKSRSEQRPPTQIIRNSSGLKEFAQWNGWSFGGVVGSLLNYQDAVELLC